MAQLEPSFDGKLGFKEPRKTALLVLAISAPVSLERQMCSIPPQIFSYAVTLLGRLSRGLGDVMDQNSLLAYLSQCSRFTVPPASENFEGKLLDFHSDESYIHPWKRSDEISGAFFPESIKLKNVFCSLNDYLVNSHVKATSYVEIVLSKVVDLWPIIKLGCMDEVVRTLRSLKEELKGHCESRQPTGVFVFALRYLRIIKLLAKAWTCYFSNLHFKGMGILEALLGKIERMLKEMLCRFTGLGTEEQLHILELMLVTHTLRLSCGGICCFDDYMKRLNYQLCRVQYLCKDGSIGLSHFVLELQSISHKIGDSEKASMEKFYLLQKSIDLYSLKHFLLSGELKYLDAEVGVFDNDFQSPLPFVCGLPVGIPFDITLYNIFSEARLWLTMSLGEKSTQHVFLDLNEFDGCTDIRKCTSVVPFFRTPKVKYFSLRVSIAMEYSSENQRVKHYHGPKHELVHLCKAKEVYLSLVK